MGVSMSRTTKEMNLVDIEKLIPYVNNARTHSIEQINKIRASLREFGFVNPVIIDKDYNIIAGHGRVAAAKAEGIKEVPCVLVDYLTPAQKKAYILADNRMALDAGWDEETLKLELEALKDDDFDLTLTGFEQVELDNLLEDDTPKEYIPEDDPFEDIEKLDKHYGVPYQGNKSRIADIIINILPSGERLVDLFGGGGV